VCPFEFSQEVEQAFLSVQFGALGIKERL